MKTSVLAVFARHPVAANLLMAMMMISGLWGLSQLNTQFFPSFDIDFVSVRVTWPGASAEDLETLVTDPLERELKGIDNVKELASLSVDGQTLITLEFRENTDMGPALDEVKERVDLVTNLPDGAESPEISRIINHELVASLLVSGPDDPRGLRALVNQFERELLEQGISHIRVFGLPEEEIAIQVSPGTLRELGLTLEDVSRKISAASRDMPVGIIGRGESALQLRFKDQRRREYAFADLPVIVAQDGRLLTLGDIATITRRPKNAQTEVSFRGKPAVEMCLSRTRGADSLESAQILRRWGDETIVLSTANTHSYRKVAKTLREYLDDHLHVQDLAVPGDETLYWFGDNDHERWAEHFDAYAPPPLIPRSADVALSFGVGGPLSGVPLHVHGPGFSETLIGRKRWWLARPLPKPTFDPNATALEWALSRRESSGADGVAFAECTVSEGEAIYFPDGWWHATLNLDETVFISSFVNYARDEEGDRPRADVTGKLLDLDDSFELRR